MTALTEREELAVLRESQDRRLDREGIPMLLVLSDERPDRSRQRADTDDGTPGDGASSPLDRHGSAHVVAELDRYRSVLAPSQRDGDMGIVTKLLQAVAFVNLNEALLP